MKLGSLLSSLMPYTFALGVVWTLFVIAWYLLGIPLGPGGPVKIRNNIPLFTIFYTRYVHKPPLSSRRFIFVIPYKISYLLLNIYSSLPFSKCYITVK